MADSHQKITRRKLFARTSQAAVATALGAEALARGADATGDGPKPDPRTIVNHHPKMRYRKMGKTGYWISEVSLGGHWRNRGGGRYWDVFAKDDVPADVAKNRTEVMSACIDAGINYLDITTAAECLSYGKALKGRRDKMIVGADDHRLGPRNFANITVPKLTHNAEECIRRLGTDYLDIWRVQARMDGSNTEAHVEVMIETAAKLIKAGKIRHFGMSSHNRDWLQKMIVRFPEIEMVIHPCTAVTKRAGAPATKDNVQEKVRKYSTAKDLASSIFDTVREKNVGLVTIKPFAGGSVFKNENKFPIMGVGLKEENDLARLTLQCILACHEEITCTVPGLTTVYEVDNAARASYTRELAMSPADRQWLEAATREGLASLPPDYQWLRDWDVI